MAQFPVPTAHIDDWQESPAYRACNTPGFKQQFSHLFGVEMWLPGRFQHEFETESLTGNRIWIGSSATLIDQLQSLNRQTWNAKAGLLKEWLRNGSEHSAALEQGARFAFALMLDLAQQSVAHNLPMRLDW